MAGNLDPALERELVLALTPVPWILAAYAFGSRVCGRARLDSDLDVALLLDSRSSLIPAAPLVRAELILDLASSLSSLLKPPVDVVDLERAGVILAHQVLSTGRKILERDPVRTRLFEAHAMMVYFDFLPVERTLARAAIADIRQRS